MKYYEFDQKAINNALDAAKETHKNFQLNATESNFDVSKGGCLQLTAECVSVTIEDHKICVNLPLGFGKHCISIPVNIPNGTAGKACLKICTTWGIPTGVEVNVVVGGVTIISQKFGKC